MYRCLNVETLGITGRQSELIELALSNRFKGIELDMETLARQVDSRGQEYATRCIDSAKKCKVGLQVGPWRLPIDWEADEARLKEQITRIPALANVAKMVEANLCTTHVLPGSDTLALQENFEFYAAKLAEIGDLLAPHGIKLAVGFQAADVARAEKEHQFVCKADDMVTLLQMVKSDNVGLYLDTWNWHLGGGTIATIEKLGVDKLFAVSIADVPADADVASIELKQRLLPDPAGVIPHVDLLNRLHELEFDGPATPTPHISQYKGITRDKIVAKVSEALRSVWPGADLAAEAAAEAVERGEDPAAAAAAATAKPEEAPAADAEGDDKAKTEANGKEAAATTAK